ncbi:MAG TPA: DUF6178 family protein [Anaeromyxobacteraceae bacterium]|nr:DUF6178 family protein [Anaeromyxobacteraceae bacterium]
MASREPKERPIAPAALARARAGLAAARGRRRLDLILDARDPEALVRALPADELWFTIRDIGLADAADLVQLASADQFKVFLDLEAWSKEGFDSARALAWLRAARAGSDLEPRAAARWERKLSSIDAEVLYLTLRRSLRVHDLDENPDPEIASDRFMRSPEGKFLIEFLVDGAEYVAVRGLLDDLYAEDPFRAARLLSSTRWESPSELEESALRWRTGRLADLGFPSTEEALSWFARPPPGPAAPAGAPDRPPGFFLAEFEHGALLDRAAARLADADREALEQQLVAAANAVLVADAVDPGDPEAVRAAIQGARALVELGLEARAGTDEGAAAAALAEAPLKRTFQEGFGRVLELKWRAERILREGGAGTREAPLLDAPVGEALAALVARRPRYFPGLEAPREEWATPAAGAETARHFLSSQELARTAAALDLAAALASLARDLGLAAPPGAPIAPRLSALYLTARANELLGRPFAPAPIAAAELPAATAALGGAGLDPRLASRGEPGAVLAEWAGRRLDELRAAPEGAAVRPELVTALLVH